jgi:uncharacterized protein
LDVPNHGGRWVVDNAGLLSPEERRGLSGMLEAYAAATTDQIVILTVPGLEGEDLADYANRVARDWGVGHKEKNNGVLVLVAKAERKVRFEVGRGLEDRLPDITCKRIQEDIVVPLFKEGRFGAGLAAGIKAMEQALGHKPVEGLKKHAATGQGGELSVLPWWAWLAIIALVLGGSKMFAGDPFFLIGLLLSLLSSRGGGGFGGGYGGRGGGGGFSGGGGDFGGGGSSSDWGGDDK